MPHVATSPGDLLRTLRSSSHLDGDRLVIDDEAAFRDAGDPRPRVDRRVLDRRRHEGRRPVARLEAGQALGARSASIQALLRGARSRRGIRIHGPGDQPARPDIRHGPDRVRDRRGAPASARSSSSSPGASRPTRCNGRPSTRPLSSPAPSPPAGRDRCSSRATTTSSTRRSTPQIPRR